MLIISIISVLLCISLLWPLAWMYGFLKPQCHTDNVRFCFVFLFCQFTLDLWFSKWIFDNMIYIILYLLTHLTHYLMYLIQTSITPKQIDIYLSI